MTVALLDSGVHGNHPHVGGVRGGASFLAGTDADDFVDRVGHGTAVAAAIREKSPAVDLIAARIFDRQLATNVDVLVRAIRWAADEGAQLINLSLGTTNPAHAEKLAPAISYAAERARSSSRRGSGTAQRGCRESRRCRRRGGGCRPGSRRDRRDVDRRGTYHFESGAVSPADSQRAARTDLSGVSFAVANVTGFLARATEALGDPFRAAGLGD